MHLYTKNTNLYKIYTAHKKNDLQKHKSVLKKSENFSKSFFFQKLLSTSVWTYM